MPPLFLSSSEVLNYDICSCTIEYRLLIAQLIIAVVAFVMLVANKLPMKYVETFYKGSNYLFFGWLFVGGTINWIITGNLSFIISYLFPYIAIPMLTASMMYIYKNFREMRKLRQTGSGAVNVNVQ